MKLPRQDQQRRSTMLSLFDGRARKRELPKKEATMELLNLVFLIVLWAGAGLMAGIAIENDQPSSFFSWAVLALLVVALIFLFQLVRVSFL